MEWLKENVHSAIQSLQTRDTKFQLVVADPPYGNIVKQKWDKVDNEIAHAQWMTDIIKSLEPICYPGAALYWWGGIGKPKFRPFFQMILDVERTTNWQLAALITWKKKRAYGVRNNYLMTREECAYFVLGNPKKPRVFNVPYLDKLRGYAGYNPKHPALDDRLRRTMVWDDVTEVFRNKKHECEKPKGLAKVIIETSSNAGDNVLDLFAGCGNVSIVADGLGRNPVAIDEFLDAP